MSAEERKKLEHVTSPAHVAAAKSAASQRRHQLESNTLKIQLHKFLATLKEGPSRSTWIVGGIIVGAVVLYFIWNHFAQSSKEKDSARWLAFMRLTDGEQLSLPADGKIAPGIEEGMENWVKANEGTKQARVTRFELARIDLAKGEKEIGSNREIALARIKKAAERYEKLESESSDDMLLHMESILNAGKAREMLGEFDDALKHYRKYISEYTTKDDTIKNAFLDEARAGEERLKEGSADRKTLEALNAALNRKNAP